MQLGSFVLNKAEGHFEGDVRPYGKHWQDDGLHHAAKASDVML